MFQFILHYSLTSTILCPFCFNLGFLAFFLGRLLIAFSYIVIVHEFVCVTQEKTHTHCTILYFVCSLCNRHTAPRNTAIFIRLEAVYLTDPSLSKAVFPMPTSDLPPFVPFLFLWDNNLELLSQVKHYFIWFFHRLRRSIASWKRNGCSQNLES